MHKTDRQIIIDIISQAFIENPRTNAMMKKKNPLRSVRIMAEYAYDLVSGFNGIYLSKDKTTVIFYYRISEFKRGFIGNLKYARMFLRAIRFSQLLPTLKREKIIRSRRADFDDYLYVWLLGSVRDKTSIRGLVDINNHLIDRSKEYNIPILIETTIEKILKLYNYVGFETYNKWHDQDADLDVWFLKRELEKKERQPA
ncbi:MAG: hypothetical protein V2I37_09805 [Marinilabiliaceae bacterium]|jgi:hypothetical protein|nr:hypothetical protein [Marinilabiliaceae bacterium]